MKYSYEQIGTVCATFECIPDVKPGEVCQMYSNNCVCRAEEDSIFDGVTVARRDDCATVQVQGFVTVSYTGPAPSVGSQFLIANELGGVYVAESGKRYLIVNVDEVNQTVTFLL